MKNILLLCLLSCLMFSCKVSTNFAKRKYTKGVYIEKHTTAKTKKNNTSKKKYSKTNTDNKEILVHQENVKKVETSTDLEKEESRRIVQNGLPNDSYVNEEQQEIEEISSPPEVNDGETLKKGDPKEPLGLVAFILAFVAVGAFAIATFSTVLISLLSASATVALGFTILSYVAVAIAVAAVIMGAISYSRIKTGKAKVAIIIGSVLIGVFLLTLLFAFLFI